MASSILPPVAFLIFLAWVAHGGRLPNVFNINDFGAIPREKIDSSQALLKAWTVACESNGTARVLIPEGTFLVGPVVLNGPCKGSMVLQVKGLVKAPTLDKFNSDTWFSFQYINGLLLTGGGTFDGQGAAAWPHNQCPKKFQCKLLPMSLRFSFVNDTTIRGITSVDSKFFHMIIFQSNNVKLLALKISAPGDSPNTDGIHIRDSSGIRIARSNIGTGDDCISIGPGSSNISISNVFCGPGHGISVGSLGRYPNENNVIGLRVKNCTFTGTINGVRIKTWQESPVATVASDLSFEDIVMKDVYNPIIIDQQYCPYASCTQKSPSRVQISNITFKSIRGVSASKVAVNLLCSPGKPCQDIKFIDIKLEYNGQEGGPSTSSCSNIKGVSLGQQIPPSCL